MQWHRKRLRRKRPPLPLPRRSDQRHANVTVIHVREVNRQRTPAMAGTERHGGQKRSIRAGVTLEGSPT